jgi:DnaJ-class molecular chaperone
MRICDHCHGKGKFEAHELKCHACDGEGNIVALQMGEGYPPVIGCKL